MTTGERAMPGTGVRMAAATNATVGLYRPSEILNTGPLSPPNSLPSPTTT